MSIYTIENKKSIFVAFQGLGSVFSVEDGKLVPLEPLSGKEMRTSPEDILNHIRGDIRVYLDSRQREIRKITAITPMLEFMAESHGPDCGCGMQEMLKEMKEGVVHMRAAITEGEAILLDIADLMAEYNLPLKDVNARTKDDEKSEVNTGAGSMSENKLNDLLSRLRSGGLGGGLGNIGGIGGPVDD